MTSVASGSNFSFSILIAAGLNNIAPLVETITGSTTNGAAAVSFEKIGDDTNVFR